MGSCRCRRVADRWLWRGAGRLSRCRSAGRFWCAAVVVACLAPAATPGIATARDADESVAFQGSLPLPDRAPDAEGRPVAITGLSGIAWLGDDRYAAVMDNSRFLLLFRLSLSQTGRPLAVESLRVVRLSQHHDYEDLAICPDPVAIELERERGWTTPDRRKDESFVMVCEEDTPAVRVCSLADGRMLGALRLPANLASRRPNRGLESVAIEPDGDRGPLVWTANEEALTGDGPAAAVGSGTVVRLTAVPLVAGRQDDAADGPDEPAVFQAAYAVDPPHAYVPVFAGQPLSGLVSLVSLGKGRLLALERSGAPGLPPFASRIFVVDTAGAADVSGIDGNLSSRPDLFLKKRLVWGDSLGINLEGLCLGPRLADGNRALLAIADNGGIGTPNQIVGLAWVTPAPAVSPALLGVAAVLMSIAVAAGRLTSP